MELAVLSPEPAKGKAKLGLCFLAFSMEMSGAQRLGGEQSREDERHQGSSPMSAKAGGTRPCETAFLATVLA